MKSLVADAKTWKQFCPSLYITEVTSDDETSPMDAVTVVEMDVLEPSYEEAWMRSDWPQWKKAIKIELQSLKAAETGRFLMV